MDHSITVIILTYNSSKFITKTIESIIYQSIRPTKIIIVDDNSNDLTFLKKLIDEIKNDKFKNIELIANSQNRGPGYNRNLGWSICNTEFIAFCDDDDIWHQDKLKYQLQILKKKKNIKLIASKKKSLNKTLNIKDSLSLELTKFSFVKLLFKNSIATSSVILRSDVKDRFLSEFYAEDYYLWLSILKKKYECYLINDNLCMEMITNKKIKLSGDILNMHRGVQKVLNKFYNGNFFNNILIDFAKLFNYLKYIVKKLYK